MDETETLDRLLPVVRTVRAGGSSPNDNHRDVIALYRDRLVMFRKRGKKPIPAEAYEPDGAAKLAGVSAVGRRAMLLLEEIRSIEAGPLECYGRPIFGGRQYGQRLRITDHTNAVGEVFLPKDEAVNLLDGFRKLPELAGKLSENLKLKRIPRGTKRLIHRPNSPMLRILAVMLAFAVASGFAAAALELDDTYVMLFGMLAFALGLASVSFLILTAASALSASMASAKRRKRDIHPLPRKARKDLSHQRPFRSVSWGTALKIIGALVFLITVSADVWINSKWPTVANIGRILAVFSYVPATCLIYYGYRISLRSAEDARQEDHRPPILYLRSFDQDARNNLNPKGFVPQLLGLEPATILAWLGPLGNINPIRLIRLLFSRSTDNSEEQFAAYFKSIGPFVAIGKPGERLALGGASRFYVGNEEWQETVLRLMRESSIVVLQPGSSEHVWWEVRETFAATAPGNILFSLVSCEGEQWKYDNFRLRFEHETGLWLPRALGDGMFLYIDGNQPRLLPLRRRWHLTWPIAGCAIHLKKTLRPFMESREGRRAAVTREAPRLVRGLSALASAVVWTVILISGTMLLELAVASGFQRWSASRAAAWLADPSRQMVVNGPSQMPFKLSFSTDWEVMPLPPELAGIEYCRIWKLSDAAAVTVSVTSVAGGNAWIYQSLGDEEILERGIGTFRDKVDKNLTVERRGTLVQADRTWQTAEMRGTFPAGFMPSEHMATTGKLFHLSADLKILYRIYAGPEGMIEFVGTVNESHVDQLEPVIDSIFRSMSLQPAVDSLSAPGEEARQAALRQAQADLPTLLAAYRRDSAASDRDIADENWMLRLKNSWTAERTGLFQLGQVASIETTSIPVPPDSRAGGDDLIRITKDLHRKSRIPSRNLKFDTIENTGLRGVLCSYETVENQQLQQRFTAHYLKNDSTILSLSASTHPELAGDLKPFLMEALTGLRKFNVAQVELARSGAGANSGKRIDYVGKNFGYHWELNEKWKPSDCVAPMDRQFMCTQHAVLFVVVEPRSVVDSSFVTADLVKFARGNAGPTFKEISTDTIKRGNITWARVKYFASPAGQQLRFTGQYLVDKSGIFQLVGCTDFIHADSHDALIDEALSGFRMPAARP